MQRINNKISFFMTALAGVIMLNSCDKTKTYDVEVAPGQIHFNNTISASDQYVSYFIPDNPNSTFTISVGTTDVINQDRTVTWKMTAPTGAVAGTHYTLLTTGNTLTIPAGQTTAAINIRGIYAPYASGLRKDTLVFTLEQPATVEIAGFSDTVRLVLQKYCDVFSADYMGDWDNVLEYATIGGPATYGPYTITLDNPQQINPTRFHARILNLWDYPTTVTAFFKYADPANHQFVISEQYSGVNLTSGGTPYQLWIRTSAGQTNTFNSCDGVIVMTCDFIAKRIPSLTTAGTFATNYRIVARR